MKDEAKVIRCWRIRAAAPCGVHLWFDPRVEHVALLEGPVHDLPLGWSESTEEVDTGPQQSLLWEPDKLSVSDSGKREALRSVTEDMSEMPEGFEDIPF